MEEGSSRHLRVLNVLEQLANTLYPQTLAQLAQRTGLPKTTLMRMLQALESAAYVTRMPGDLGYVPGPRASQLSLHVLRTPHFLRACRHVLGKLITITGEACNLTAPAGDAVHYLARVESPDLQRLQLHMEIGAHVPLHCTASGKLFLAFAPDIERQQILNRVALKALTPKTIVDRQQLDAELRHIRSLGIGIDNEEFVRGMVAIAVPVHDAQEQVIAAVACHAATAQKSLQELLEYTEPMRQAAKAMTAVLSAQAPQPS
ncbi:IclR family transcriptional regulator [Allopusillimonas ginsengisoli]|uniref:IclR family transcriptional regulator n=1 Tax=Allopusillimonas ginsengisoli TaxID=453575 RepID=UPI00102106EA|nr:IclR family transcriptional regulator [Allopusillimonas ginsengisoli]TEA79858.1 IclR family transcriptional regulator [Allopusillimonas ginsengisoli]